MDPLRHNTAETLSDHGVYQRRQPGWGGASGRISAFTPGGFHGV